jgi:hypothetical protein
MLPAGLDAGVARRAQLGKTRVADQEVRDCAAASEWRNAGDRALRR